jgi:hypothetical protein
VIRAKPKEEAMAQASRVPCWVGEAAEARRRSAASELPPDILPAGDTARERA